LAGAEPVEEVLGEIPRLLQEAPRRDKSLQAVKTLGVLSPQDELLSDTIQLVDQALNRAV
jgi:hypothetical protein